MKVLILLTYQKYSYFLNINAFQASISFKYQYFWTISVFQVLTLFRYQHFSNTKSIITFQIGIRSINMFQVSKELMYLKYINTSQVAKVSILFKHQCYSSINTFQISILFKYQYFSNISTFQVSTLLKY